MKIETLKKTTTETLGLIGSSLRRNENTRKGMEERNSSLSNEYILSSSACFESGTVSDLREMMSLLHAGR